MKKKWFPSVLDVFRREGKDDEEVSASLLSAVSTLMFNQLRTLLTASIDELVEFFEKFAIEEQDVDADLPAELLASEAVTHRPLFVVKMVVEGESYKFSPSLPTLLKTVLGTIDHFVAMLNTVPRVEAELGKSTGHRLLTVATPDDEVTQPGRAATRPAR